MVYNGIHAQAFNEPVDSTQVRALYNIPPHIPLILSVGRLIPQKGPDILIGKGLFFIYLLCTLQHATGHTRHSLGGVFDSAERP